MGFSLVDQPRVSRAGGDCHTAGALWHNGGKQEEGKTKKKNRKTILVFILCPEALRLEHSAEKYIPHSMLFPGGPINGIEERCMFKHHSI